MHIYPLEVYVLRQRGVGRRCTGREARCPIFERAGTVMGPELPGYAVLF